MKSLGDEVRIRFPILSTQIDGHPLVYLDNAATTQKPQSVIDALSNFYEHDNGNIKRGMHPLAERSTELYEDARKRVQKFVNAKHAHEIIFTKNCTEALNIVAHCWGRKHLHKGDVVLLSLLEHHSNIVPWLQLKEEIGIEIEWIEIEKSGKLKVESVVEKLKSGKVKLISISCISNVLGIHTEYIELTHLAHQHGALVCLDAAQLAPHHPIDIQNIDCDFLAFSGHKIYGPTGIGVLYGKKELLQDMHPWIGGGGMIQEVHKDRFSPAEIPDKFEGGTPPIAQAIGLHAALDFLKEFDWKDIESHEKELVRYALQKLSELECVEILGPNDPEKITGCVSFVTPPVHPHDLTEVMGRNGVCLRAGHHCTQPLHDFLGHPATSRLSVGVYNTKEDIDRMSYALKEGYTFFQRNL